MPKDFLKLAIRRVRFQTFWTPSLVSFKDLFFFVSLVYFQELTLSTQALFSGSLSSKKREIGPTPNKFWTNLTLISGTFLGSSQRAAG